MQDILLTRWIFLMHHILKSSTVTLFKRMHRLRICLKRVL
nr:hypothetical protein Iba_chr14cCG15580 [Ipomoea batatas]